jgi:hypothetical protein
MVPKTARHQKLLSNKAMKRLNEALNASLLKFCCQTEQCIAASKQL